MPLIQGIIFQVEELVKIFFPKLAKHFEAHGIMPTMYQLTQWFVTVFLATNLPFEILLRVWDVFLNEGMKTIYRVGLGLLKYYEKTLLKSEFEGIINTIRNLPGLKDPDKFMKQCFEIKLTRRQLGALEKKFHTQKPRR